MSVLNWKPMEQADKARGWYARDADGMEAWTWHDGDEWTRESWRETNDREEYPIEEWWAPVLHRAEA